MHKPKACQISVNKLWAKGGWTSRFTIANTSSDFFRPSYSFLFFFVSAFCAASLLSAFFQFPAAHQVYQPVPAVSSGSSSPSSASARPIHRPTHSLASRRERKFTWAEATVHETRIDDLEFVLFFIKSAIYFLSRIEIYSKVRFYFLSSAFTFVYHDSFTFFTFVLKCIFLP